MITSIEQLATILPKDAIDEITDSENGYKYYVLDHWTALIKFKITREIAGNLLKDWDNWTDFHIKTNTLKTMKKNLIWIAAFHSKGLR